jgi:hypothetical protein
MGSSFSVRRARGRLSVSSLLLSCVALSACSTPDGGDVPEANEVGGSAGQRATGAGSGGAPSSSGGSLAAAGAGTSGLGGAVSIAGAPNDAAQAGQAGSGGVTAAGAHAGGAGAGGGGVAAGGAGGSAGANAAVCEMVKTEYAAELEKQLACKPGAPSQCTNKVAAAPGCECRVFIQPADPFAIEHLSNVGNGWFEADCSMASCPVKCSTAAAGTCQTDAKFSLGGRCVTP